MLFCAVALGAVLGVRAETYYVATTGLDTNAGTESAPLKTIAAALAKADVTEIVVAAGTYVQTASVNLAKAVTLRGATGNPADVVLDGQAGASTRVASLVVIGHASAVLENLRLTHAAAPNKQGGGVHFTAAGTVRNCVIDDCVVSGNTLISGIGVYLDKGGLVTGSVISNCTARLVGENDGVAVRIVDGTLENTLVCGSSRSQNGDSVDDSKGAVHLSRGAVVGCTIVGNVLSHAALVVDDSAACTVRDSIVWGNTALRDGGPGRPNVSIGARAVVSNLCTTAAVGTDPVVQNPCFANAAAGDYSLLPGSPCIGAGTGGRDLGCKPFDATRSALGFRIAGARGAGSLASTVSLVASGAYALDGASVAWEGLSETGTSFTKTFGPGRHALAATVNFADGGSASVRLEEAIVVTPTGDMYVDAASENPVFPYATPETAARTLEDALDLVGDGLAVHVAEGTYALARECLLADAVKVIASGARDKTIVDANARCRHFSLCHADALVAGLWLTRGYATRGAGSVYIGGSGGTVSNCVVNGGRSGQNVCDGGGIWMKSPDALVTHSVVMNCSASSYGAGAGVKLDSGTLANSLVVSNSVVKQDNKGSLGGGVHMGVATAAAKVVNCTIAHNRAYQGGGLYRVKNGGTVVNTIVYDNASTEGSQDIFVVAGGTARPEATSFRNVCTAADSAVGIDCQTAAASPYELPTYELSAAKSTACIDRGTNEGLVSETDITGATSRTFNGIADIGAYEYAQSSVAPGILFGAGKVLAGTEAAFEATVQNASIDDCVCTWYLDGSDEAVWTGRVYRTTLGLGPHSLRLRLEVGGAVYERIEPVGFVTVYPTDIYVAAEGKSVPPYATWNDAATNVADAVALQVDGMCIHVGPGQFPVKKALAVTSGITLAGAGKDATVVYRSEQAGVSRVLEINSADSLVRCLTVSNGCADLATHGNNVMISGNGGTIEECRIVGGHTASSGRQTSGGGIFLTGPGSCCRRCEITGNKTSFSDNLLLMLTENGGGAFVQGNARLESCLVRGNVANGNGGGVCAEGGFVRNCTIVDNESYRRREPGDAQNPARYGAGLFQALVVFGSVPAHGLVNNIVVGNLVTNVLDGSVSELNCGVAVLAQESKFENTCSKDAIGSNCITADPQFVDVAAGDYRLREKSPCRQAGLYLDWMEGELDFFGNSRSVGRRRVDIGFHQLGPFGFLLMLR